MNTNGFLTFASILLVVTYLLVYRYDPEHEGNMAKFIPDNALVYIEQRNGKRALDTFIHSELGRNLAEIDFTRTGKTVGLSQKIISLVNSIQKNYAHVFDNEIIELLLGERVGVAFFYPDKAINTYTVSSYLKENSIIIAEPRYNADLIQLFGKHSVGGGGEDNFRTTQYGNHQISRIDTPEGGVALSVIEGMLLASFNEKQLRRAIDAYDGDGRTLFDIEEFRSAQQKFNKPERFIYLPVDTIHTISEEVYSYIGSENISLVQQQLDNILGFTGVFYGAWPYEKVVEDKIIFSYRSGQTNDEVTRLLKTTPGSNSMLELTTADPLAYYWSNTLDLGHFLDYLPEDKNSANPVTEYIDKLEQISPYTIEEILSNLGQEVSLVVEKGGEENFIPVPVGAAFFRVNPDVDLSKLTNYIVDAFEVPVIEQIYNSVTYLYWVASPQDGLQPLCGYWSNLFFIGNSAQLIERVIDGYNENESLLDNPKVKDIDPGMTELNNSVTYLNNIEILELTKRLLSALATLTTIEDKEKAAKARIAIREVIIPLFNGLKEYQRSCTRSYFEPGMVIINSKTSVARKETH